MIETWIAFGSGKDFRYVPAHDISASLSPRKSVALPVFYASNSCGPVSRFAHVGNKPAWKVWESHDDVNAAFCEFQSSRGNNIRRVFSFGTFHHTHV